MSANVNVVGVDADRQRLAIGSWVDARADVATVPRMDSAGRFHANYHAALADVMGRCRRVSAVVFLEGIFLPRTGHVMRNVETFRVLANVQGEILFEAARYGVEVRVVPPVSWQSRVLGITKDRERIKAASREEAQKLIGGRVLTEHESDAACLALYGLWVVRNEAAAS